MNENITNNIMMIDDEPVAIEGEKNLLEVIRKAGIELPTFCYYSELSVYGACRMCMVENKYGSMEAACSTPPRPGMQIYTNTPKLRKYRKMILELLLSNHCRDCTACEKNGSCRLQQIAARFDIHRIRFDNTAPDHKYDDSSLCITRDAGKCILCGDCVRVCSEVQHVGAIEFANRGSKMKVSTSFEIPISESECVGCGQCAAVCPTAAIIVKNDAHRLWRELNREDTLVVAQIAPAVRTAVAEALGYKGENVMGKIVACLKKMGINKVFDTSTSADLTVIEEANEFIGRIEKGEKLPLFTSCCPAWVKFCENRYPELLPNVSTCRSPMQMFASVINEQYKNCGKRLVSVAIMPCTAKKAEAAREEFRNAEGKQMVDYVITTQELVRMIKESGIVFNDIEPEAVDMPFGTISGAGVIFGVTGGVTEAVIRYAVNDPAGLKTLAYEGPRGLDGIKEFSVMLGDKPLRIAVVSGLKNAEEIISRLRNGEHYDLIEVMACPNGCINGAGQPPTNADGRAKRSKTLYKEDKMSVLKRSQDNPLMNEFYSGVLKGKVHELLHVDYVKK